MSRSLGITATLGFALALGVNAATVLGIDVYSRMPLVWLLHIGAVLLFCALVLSATRTHAALGEIVSRIPGWAVVAAGAAFAYALINAFVSLRISGEGNAVQSGSGYVLTTHGRLLAHLAEREYHARRAAELRLFSGGWLLFYLSPALYFLLGREYRVVCGYRSRKCGELNRSG